MLQYTLFFGNLPWRVKVGGSGGLRAKFHVYGKLELVFLGARVI